MEKIFDTTNKEQVLAYQMIQQTNNSFFLTGRAGSGKTTFLRYARETINKNFLVLAPTGIAAINAGGQTIHSFFGFEFGVLDVSKVGNLNKNKIELVRRIDTIIIDEVSMVRCDIIDAIDRALRRYVGNSAPFGGKQMVFVGDMFQLEPIATQKDRELLEAIYGHNSLYFYDSFAVSRISLPKIEFLKIYRQPDPVFQDLLEHLRVGRMTNMDYRLINSRVSKTAPDEEMYITLTTRRKDAELINLNRLAAIAGDSKEFVAEYEGDVKQAKDVVDERLVLKVGAQVMFVKNDSSIEHRWVNGTLAEVVKMDDNDLIVKLSNGQEYQVFPEMWECVDYEYDMEHKRCRQVVIGTIKQIPLRLAWAITIHKSQSLTFDKVAVDFGWGAFSNGQAYVALSRARTLEGLRLVNPMWSSSVRVSESVLNFAAEFNDSQHINRELSIGQAVNEYEKANDYDGAASTLYDMAIGSLNCGDEDYAYECLKRAMDYVVDDECLKGKILPWSHGSSEKSRLMNACGLYYKGDIDIALSLLDGFGFSNSESDLLALYIKSRCLEEREMWLQLEDVYNKMIDIYSSSEVLGLDSIAFRKMKYRLAILNESHYGDPGISIIRSLIFENPCYDKYHIALRWMLRQYPELCRVTETEDDTSLVELLLDDGKSEDLFLCELEMARANRTSAWKGYRQFLAKMKLERAI